MKTDWTKICTRGWTNFILRNVQIQNTKQYDEQKLGNNILHRRSLQKASFESQSKKIEKRKSLSSNQIARFYLGSHHTSNSVDWFQFLFEPSVWTFHIPSNLHPKPGLPRGLFPFSWFFSHVNVDLSCSLQIFNLFPFSQFPGLLLLHRSIIFFEGLSHIHDYTIIIIILVRHGTWFVNLSESKLHYFWIYSL